MKRVLSGFIILSSISSQAQVMGGAYGFANAQGDSEGLHEVSEQSIGAIASELSHALHANVTDEHKTNLIKQTFDRWNLNNSENKDYLDRVINDTLIIVATASKNQFGYSGIEGIEKLSSSDPLDSFSNALTSLSYPSPGNLTQMKELKNLNEQDLDTPTYLNKLKTVLPSYSEEFKKVLERKYQEKSFSSFPDSGLYLEEMYKLGIDQGFLRSALDGAYFQNDIDTMKLIAKYYDFDYVPSFAWQSQPILCDTLLALENQFIMEGTMAAAAQGDTVVSTSSSSENNYKKHLIEHINKKAKTLIGLGADPRVSCHDGKTFSQKVEDFIERGAELNLSLLGVSNSQKLGEKCPGVSLDGLEDLCDISRAMVHFNRVLDKNSSSNFVDGMRSGKCDLTLLTQYVEDMNGGKSRELGLRIVPENSSKEILLSGKDKEELKLKIEELIQKSKKK